jgi:polyphosphate kinase 2 (PPK2 family)
MLEKVDLGLALAEKEYWRRIGEEQLRLHMLQRRMFQSGKCAALVMLEGWDAAGKGGAIKRVTETLDPRGYEVVAYAAPHGDEKTHHYLWRFWKNVPPRGRMSIYDRTHYGRVLVERCEGFCSEEEWRRAYREINEWEGHLLSSGCLVMKFWLHLSKEEQLRRFKSRERDPFRQYKLTEEDWRNRARWKDYEEAVEQMLQKTSTPLAPWTVVEANDKYWARVKIVKTIADRLEEILGPAETNEKGKKKDRKKDKKKGRK